MDRPLGPRQTQSNARHAAYESIFGRPSASHHQPSGYGQMSNAQMYYYQQHQPQYQPDRASPYAPPPPQPYYPPQSQSSASLYRRSFQSQQVPQHQPAAAGYAQPIPQNYHHQSSLAPPSVAPRATSLRSSSHTVGIISPQPEEPPDPTLDALTQQGLTPAQAYQAQVYLNSPAGQQGQWRGFQQSVAGRDPSSLAPALQAASSSMRHSPDPPQLALDVNEGGLGLDFVGRSSENGDPKTDDSSELPWAQSDAKPVPRVHRTGSPSSPLQNRFSNASDQAGPTLHVDTAAQSIRSSVASTSPTSFTMVEHGSLDHATSSTLHEYSTATARRSSESARTMPRLNGPRKERTVQDRAMSMSAVAARPIPVNRPAIPSLLEGGRGSPNSVQLRPRKSPIVYPALISRVAEAFRDRIALQDRLKDGLTYKNAFDGREAVDKIAYIIKTTDRNLALLLGRALDAQKFFHDVTYDHRLRDTPNELYQFQTKLSSPFASTDLTDENGTAKPGLYTNDSGEDKDDGGIPSPSPSIPPHNQLPKDALSSDEVELPSGVFTLLTDCYSPTCSRDQLCYSIACPRRLEQQARLNMKPAPGLSKQMSKESLVDAPPEDGTLWIHSVPEEIVKNVSELEKKRQEAINEVIYTERDFVRDMEYLRDFWIKPLQESEVIPQHKRTEFLEQVFWNVFDVIAMSSKVRDALHKRQKHYAVVEKIGDIFLEHVPSFSPFVSYGAHQLYGKYEFEREKASNPDFALFVEQTERRPESRKLELNAYLTKPTTRLARYPLLLEAVLKHTPDDNPDKIMLPQAVALVREFLGKVNAESGKTENRFNLLQLKNQLQFRPGDQEVDLRLEEHGREIVYKGPLSKRDGELQVYLFDHALLFAKVVKNKQHEYYKVYRKPIPLELLLISASEDLNPSTRGKQRHGLVKKGSFSKDGRTMPHAPAIAVKPDAKGHWINFIHLGRKYYSLMLWANSPLIQKKWLESIHKQQMAMKEKSNFFEMVPLSEGFFIGPNKVNCAAPYGGGRRVVYGTDDGVYISDLRDVNKDPVKVLALLDVLQVDVLEDYSLLIVLSERQVITFPLDALNPMDPMSGLKRAKRISSHTTFFKAGYCLGKMLVCIVKSSQLSSTFKTLEPIDQTVRGRAKPTFRKLLQGGHDTLQLFREFYIPVESTSIHYLKTKMCVGCSRGFEIVDLENLDTQGLLDPNDEDLDFVRKRENLRPMAIYRIHNEFLLCYDEFAFYVNKTGRRSRKEFLVNWEGTPTGFALHEPFVLAFEPTFVEIRHIETGHMSQVIQGSNLRLLFADNPPSVTNATNPYQPNMYGGYGPHMQYPGHYQRGGARDEILMVSDDRVFSLQSTMAQHQRYMPDNASMTSMPR